MTGLAGQLANYAWLREGGGSSTAAFGLMGAQMAYLLSQRAHMAKQYPWLAVLGICGQRSCPSSATDTGPAS